MMKYLTKLNIVFAIQLGVVFFVAIGYLPREAALFLAGLLVFYALFEPLEESVFLVARSIPLFIALPITESFDSFNAWRPVVFILFLKTGWRFRAEIFSVFRTAAAKFKNSLFEPVKYLWRNNRLEFLAFLLLFVSILSLIFKANAPIFGLRRLVYFANLGMLFFAAKAVVKKENLAEFSRNVLISGLIVSAAGVLQLVSSYLMTIDDFAKFWALTIQQNLYGKAWAYIVISSNTWFAYYGDVIHLRVFSSFPDTHSFPLFLLAVCVFALTLLSRKKFFERKNYFWLLSALALFTAFLILSGTRGIWASAVFPAILSAFLYWKFPDIRVFGRVLFLPVLLFFLLLPLAALVYTSPQFKSPATETEKNIFAERFKSIIDAGETSNSGRIYIWKETFKSIAREPLLGVGVGNFPVVLKEDVALLKAGSSAHNLYLNILAEIGILGFSVFCALLFETFKAAKKLAAGRSAAPASRRAESDLFFPPGAEKFFGLSFLIYFVWILGYSLTDAAIFDERPFLMTMLLLGALFSLINSKKTNSDLIEN